jgi:hypothetical protein
MIKLDNLERPDQGESYVKGNVKANTDKIDKIDYNTNGCCMAPSFKERENCLHSHFIYILWDNCEYFNVITRKCMRPDDGK